MLRNLQLIQTVILLAQGSSFSEVAKTLHVSVTAISKQLKNLEAQIGQQLFVRTTRQVHLTDFGQQFYQQCLQVQEQLGELEQLVDASHQEPQGKLRIVCAMTLGRDYLLQRLAAFKQAYPKIELEIIFSENIVPDKKFNADILFGFGHHPGITDEWRYHLLFKVKHVLVAAPSYLKRKPVNTTADLLHADMLNLNLRQPANAIKTQKGPIKTAMPKLIMSDFAALNQACVEGMGVFLSADVLVNDLVKQGKLVTLLPKLAYHQFEIFMFYRPMQYEQTKVQAAIGFFSE